MEDESTNTTCYIESSAANATLITIYIVIFIGGTIGAVVMIFLITGMNRLSVTNTSVLNLLIVHGLFLITVPFRIAYYFQNKWNFRLHFCRLVSAMIHLHIYISFIFYVIMLSMRYISFFKQMDKIEFYRTFHSLVASGAVWVLICVIILPLVLTKYGTTASFNETQCFQFQEELKDPAVIKINYFITAVMFTVVCLLLAVQIFIIVQVMKKVGKPVLAHQETWIQLKSIFFILVMIICFFPFHIFKIYYMRHTRECFYYNEICLSITALSCLDFLLFGLKTYFQRVT
ncbi:probable G-protein coupled receptor 141 [Pseudophryne corroboree]|uniref:probable G-protein coupled receptor 141 n=1 Tax=Pseudophryne corroboree TaxID=495146 RepID=UPI00308150D8